MGTRLELQALLLEICDYVYFQPPDSLTMNYPCIVYRRDSGNTEFADDIPYNYRQRYQITVIDEDPDSPIPAEIRKIKTCVFDRSYPADNLNHEVYRIFF